MVLAVFIYIGSAHTILHWLGKVQVFLFLFGFHGSDADRGDPVAGATGVLSLGAGHWYHGGLGVPDGGSFSEGDLARSLEGMGRLVSGATYHSVGDCPGASYIGNRKPPPAPHGIQSFSRMGFSFRGKVRLPLETKTRISYSGFTGFLGILKGEVKDRGRYPVLRVLNLQ